MATYDLEESIRIQGGPRLEMLPLVRKAIEMMLHDEKGRALEYLKLANQVERLYQEVPDLYEAVLTSSFGPQPFHGLLDGDDDEDDQDRRSCSREETCDEEQGFEERYQDQHAYGRCEDRCKLDKRETCDEERDLEGRDCDCHHEDHCKLKRRERCTEEGCDRELFFRGILYLLPPRIASFCILACILWCNNISYQRSSKKKQRTTCNKQKD